MFRDLQEAAADLRKVLPDRMQTRMATLNIQAADLSKMLGKGDRSQVTLWLKGSSFPSAVSLVAIAKVLQTNVSYLVGEADYVGVWPRVKETHE